MQSLYNKLSCLVLDISIFFYGFFFLFSRTCWWLGLLPSCGWYHPLLGQRAWPMWSMPLVLPLSWASWQLVRIPATSARQVPCLTWADWTPPWWVFQTYFNLCVWHSEVFKMHVLSLDRFLVFSTSFFGAATAGSFSKKLLSTSPPISLRMWRDKFGLRKRTA